jgi:GNAT superfamily N-acetyltransferase
VIYRSDALACGPAHALGVASEDVVAFYNANWNRPIALGRQDFYDWQFKAAPESSGLDHACVAIKDGTILGVMGLNPRSFRLQGRTGYAAELTTWVVSEAARGQGVGRGIMTSLQGTFPLLFGLGISDEAMQIYTMAGFRHLRYIPRYFRVLDLEPVRDHAKVAPLGERLVKAWRPAAEVAHTARARGRRRPRRLRIRPDRALQPLRARRRQPRLAL